MPEEDLNLDLYADYLFIDENLSKLSIDVYLQVVKDYLNFCHKKMICYHDYTSIEEFYIKSRLRARTLLKYTSALNSYFCYCVKRGFIVKNPVEEIDKIKLEKKIVKPIKENDILNFFSICAQDKELGIRDKAMFMTLYYSGLRASELVNIELKDVDFSLGCVKICGKRNKERLVPLNSQTLKAIDEYIETLRAIHNRNNSSYLFLSRNGDKLTRNQIWHRMKKFAPDEQQKIFFPHAFRHSFATKLLRNDCSINNIKDILGHSSIATTQIYADIDNNTIKKEYFRVFNKLS